MAQSDVRIDAKFVRLGEAAKKAGVSPHTLRRWVKAGLVPSFRTPGGQIIFRETDLRDLFVEVPVKASA